MFYYLLYFCILPRALVSAAVAVGKIPETPKKVDEVVKEPQSPIHAPDIENLTRTDVFVRLHRYNVPLHVLDVYNTGHTIEMRHFPKEMKLRLSDFHDTYRPEYLQFRWPGEHLIGPDDVVPLEMQIVHRNVRYKSFKKALRNVYGVLGLSIRFVESSVSLELFRDIEKDIRFLQNSSRIGHRIRFHSNKRFEMDGYLHGLEALHYNGTLTTPPYRGPVRWVVVINKFDVSSKILKLFKSVQHISGHNIENNNRVVQPLNNRTLELVRVVNRSPVPFFRTSAALCIRHSVNVLIFSILGIVWCNME